MRRYQSIVGIEEGEKRLNLPTKIVDIFPLPFELVDLFADDGVDENIEEFW